MMLTIAEAKAKGFAIDTTCYPHIAYKGCRFEPREVAEVLTAREAELAAQVRALEIDLEVARTGKRPHYRAAREWRLSPQEASVFEYLLGAPERQSIDIMAYFWPNAPEGSNIVSVVICHLRKKLAPHGIAIANRWGEGYALENRAGIKAMLRGGSATLQ